jgi:hypothetical protein
VELAVERKEVAQRTIVGIFLEGGCVFVIKVVSNASRGNEFEAAEAATLVGIDDWIEDDVNRVQVQAFDGPNLGGDTPRLPIAVIDAELEIYAIEQCVIVGVGAYG